MSTDIELIVEACRNEQKRDKIEKLICLIKDWEVFIDLAYAHGVFPLVYKTLKSYEELISQDILHSMKMSNMEIVKENMLMTAELIKVMKLLEENNIEALAFKGPTLAQLVYGNIVLRQYSDLDILVNQTQVYSAAKIFKENNFTMEKPLNVLKNKTLLHIGSDISFFDFNGIVHIEVHWNLFRKLLLKKNQSFDIWNTKSTILLNNYPVAILEKNYLLLYLCIHGSKHIWERIEWIVDIDKLIRNNNLDWNFLIKNSKNLNSYTMLLLGLSLSLKLFETPIPNNIQRLLHTHKINSLSLEIIELLVKNTMHESKGLFRIFFKFKLITRMQDNYFQAIKYYLSSIFKPTHYDIYAINIPSMLSFLYYFVRPLRLFIKLFRKN